MQADRYTVRPHSRSQLQTYRLTTEGVQVEENGSKKQRLISWKNIVRVELFYAPTGGAAKRFACKLNLHDDSEEVIYSCSYLEFKNYTDQATAFTTFVHQLHQDLAKNAPDCKFGRKRVGWLQLARISFATTCIAFQLLIILLLWQDGAPRWSYSLVILPGLALLPLFYQLFRTNLHDTYRPNAIPKHLLPDNGTP